MNSHGAADLHTVQPYILMELDSLFCILFQGILWD